MFGPCIAVAFAVAAATPTPAELRQGVEDSDAALRGFGLECHIDTELASIDGKATMLAASEDWTVSAEISGRIRYESVGVISKDAGMPGVSRRERVRGAFNGTQARSMWTNGQRTFVIGQVDRNRAGVRFRLDPLETVAKFFGESVSEHLAGHSPMIAIGDENWEGHTVYVLEVSYPPPPGASDHKKARFWVDPSRGFAVVKRAALTRARADGRWKEYYRVEGYDHREVATGLWMPMRVVVENIGNSDIRAARYQITVKHWDVNPNFGDATFEFPFESGVNVTNRITGKSYQAWAASDGMFTDQLSAKARGETTNATMRWIFVSINLLIVIALAALVAYRRMRRSRHL